MKNNQPHHSDAIHATNLWGVYYDKHQDNVGYHYYRYHYDTLISLIDRLKIANCSPITRALYSTEVS
jgi:hypothetical protein